jgi:hypothetical protein
MSTKRKPPVTRPHPTSLPAQATATASPSEVIPDPTVATPTVAGQPASPPNPPEEASAPAPASSPPAQTEVAADVTATTAPVEADPPDHAVEVFEPQSPDRADLDATDDEVPWPDSTPPPAPSGTALSLAAAAFAAELDVSEEALAISTRAALDARLGTRTLRDLIDRFTQEEALENSDLTVSLSKLRMNDTGQIEVPHLGALEMTDWSRSQLASELGLRWNKWFEDMTPEERAEEINRRFQRKHQELRLRSTRDVALGSVAGGTLRAYVGSSYTPVAMSRLAILVAEALSTPPRDLRVLRFDQTDKTTSFVIAIGTEYIAGGPGQVGDVWGSVLVRNSGVGHSKLFVAPYLVRLACLNGMTLPIRRKPLVAKRHKGVDDSSLKAALTRAFQNLAQELRDGVAVLVASEGQPLIDTPGIEIDRVLELAELPQKLKKPILEAYDKEPLASRFGIAQALTAAAQTLSPEARIELEEVASKYLQGTLGIPEAEESQTPPPSAIAAAG